MGEKQLLLLVAGFWILGFIRSGRSAGQDLQPRSGPQRSGLLVALAVGENDGQYWGCQEDSPERNDEAQNYGREYGRPERNFRAALHDVRLQKQPVDHYDDGI